MEAEGPGFRHILQRFGEVSLYNHSSDVELSLLYGMFIVLFWLSTRILLEKGFSNRATWVTFIVTLTGFLIATLTWAATISTSTIITRAYSTNWNNTNSTTLEAKVEQSAAGAYVSETAFFWGQLLLPLTSDVVVIWRAWVLFPQQRWIMIGPLLLLVGTFGTTLAALGVRTASPESPTTDTLINAGIIMSLGSNALSTLLIFYKLWTYRKFIRQNVGILRRPSHVQNILVLLVESGLFFLLLQVGNLVSANIPNGNEFVLLAVSNISIGILGMSPTLMVILVHYQNSTQEAYGISVLIAGSEIPVRDVEARPVTVGHLSFAVPQSTTRSAGAGASGSETDTAEVEKSGIENHENVGLDTKVEGHVE